MSVPAPPDILARLGWDAAFAEAFEPRAAAGDHAGRVSRVDRGFCTVITAAGTLRAGTATAPELPAVGDWVAVSPADATITAVLPRRSSFTRMATAAKVEAQVLAANIDTVFIVVSLASAWNVRRLERYLAVAWQSGAMPVVVLTKADLCRSPEPRIAEAEAAAVGVDVHVASGVTGDGIDQVRDYARFGRTVALLGLSGVGKSTLVNALVGDDTAATAEVRSDGKGRHTTTRRELLVLPDGGVVIDTPGLRGLALWDADEGIERTFADLEELATQCRFNDCQHEAEPGCAVLAALAGGTITRSRLDSWQKLQGEAHWLTVRKSQQAKSDERKRWKARMREAGPTRPR
ncbi:MAG: ribosome biosis GTPase / thiamine phosphate phosphatase [Acidimicrobiaceae bacterium]|nr:ribosome biosis GTPase / thiamine phosphate phosphatase [Acidimicrobiaceae bacterium]